MTGSDLKDRVTILRLQDSPRGLSWVPTVPIWAKAEYQTRKSLWSAVGTGARGVSFTIRDRELDLSRQALRWHGHHVHITDTEPVDGSRGFLAVHGALVEPLPCRADADRVDGGKQFPGILTEKYVQHEEPDFHGEVHGTYVLVTPKAVKLDAGSWVDVMGTVFFVQTPHERLDPHKNEYEVVQRGDC